MILSLRKPERLCLRRSIDTLFSSGESFFVYPYKVLWREVPAGAVPVAWLISVPKKNLRKAVSRNLIRRRSREIYRKLKPSLVEILREQGRSVHLGMVYCAKQEMPTHALEPKMQKIMEELICRFKKRD